MISVQFADSHVCEGVISRRAPCPRLVGVSSANQREPTLSGGGKYLPPVRVNCPQAYRFRANNHLMRSSYYLAGRAQAIFEDRFQRKMQSYNRMQYDLRIDGALPTPVCMEAG
jgi:hypothetical protein